MRYKFIPIYKYAGVYIIKNQTTNKVYVGSSLNIEERIRGHRLALQRGNHPCSELQADYDKGCFFSADVLYAEIVHKDVSFRRRGSIYALEREFIKKYDAINNGYNRLPVGAHHKIAARK